MITYGSNFIRGLHVEADDLYESLIEYNKIAPDLHEGLVSVNTDYYVDKTHKTGLDCDLTNNELLCSRYCDLLQNVLTEYIQEFPYSNNYAKFGISKPIILCRYRIGDGFHAWHCERGSNDPVITGRHLTFMTYLNDVIDGGETEFYHQELKIPARKGLTLIWPTDWTYTHRGIPAVVEEKHIVTGWFSFYE